MTETRGPSVLVLGVYLLEARNNATEIAAELDQATHWTVHQRWAAIGADVPPERLYDRTFEHSREPIPKFVLLNRLLHEVDLDTYDALLVVDDDIDLPAGFVDSYLDRAVHFNFALSQPARTHDSYTDHHFVAALNGLEARQTRFVEIGPVFSLLRSAYPHLLPFDEDAPMGWGLDSVWPLQIEAAGLLQGIIDATPIRHALRKPVTYYSHAKTDQARNAYLARHPHLPLGRALVATATYPVTAAGAAATVAPPDQWPPARSLGLTDAPSISAILCTHNRAGLLRRALGALCGQSLSSDQFEVIIVDDGSADDTPQVARSFADLIPVRYFRQAHAGLAAAKNHGIAVARAPIVVFLDDDDVLSASALEQHLKTHEKHPETHTAVLGYTGLAGQIASNPLMDFVTGAGAYLFSYPGLRAGEFLDYTYFWGGRSSCKRELLMQEGVFNPAFQFGCEDIELGYRLSRASGLRVVYNPDIVSTMIRCLDFEGFCRRCTMQGRSNRVFSDMHPVPEIQQWTEMDTAAAEWQGIAPRFEEILRTARNLDRLALARTEADLPLDDFTRTLLHRAYHAAFRACRIKGSMEAASMSRAEPIQSEDHEAKAPGHGGQQSLPTQA